MSTVRGPENEHAMMDLSQEVNNNIQQVPFQKSIPLMIDMPNYDCVYGISRTCVGFG
jgi:hypothetical protein